MVSAVIVVSKILRTGEYSRIFNPYNPWMQGLYSLLFEYQKFYITRGYEPDKIIFNEIQLVLKNMHLNENQLRESTLFRDFDNQNTRNNELMHLKRKIEREPLIILPEIIEEQPESTKIEVSFNRNNFSQESQYKQEAFEDEKVIIVESGQKFPNINPQFLQQMVNQGINVAMRDIIEAVILRVIPIASITTRSLVLKDFALELDPEKLKFAAHSTAKSLAGMLAQITCKDILKYQFMKSLKDLVYQSQDPVMRALNDEEKKDLIETLTKENSEIGCKKIIDEVQKRAIDNISKDDSILQEIGKREKYQQDGVEFRNFNNMGIFERLPDVLKPQVTGLTDAEFQVYQDYDNIENMIESVLDDEHDSNPRSSREESKTPTTNENQNHKILSRRFVKF